LLDDAHAPRLKGGIVKGFTAIDLTPQCEVRLKAHYEYGLLEQINGASELIGECATEIWRSPESFERTLDGTGRRLSLRWAATAASAGILVAREGEKTLALSLLAGGLDRDADRVTLETFHKHVVRLLHNTGFEPAFDLLDLCERPLLATIGFYLPEKAADRRIFALADRCFAAAYFRRLGLA
jgi:hypothetical protein